METSATPRHQPKFVRWALLAGVVILLNIFFTTILSVAYPEPINTCPIQPISNVQTCDTNGGTWAEYGSPSGYCDFSTASCQIDFQSARNHHDLYSFLLLISFGIITLIIGLLPLGSSIISSGLSYGGVLALIFASVRYWGSAGNWIRLLIVTTGLILVIAIGLRRFKD